MTKERRLAIKMWQEIVDMLEIENINVNEMKKDFCRNNNIRWENSCWFCQYVRKDHRSNLKSRCNIDYSTNGCEDCPLYKEFASRHAIPEDDFCGCAIEYDTLFAQVFEPSSRTKKLNSAKIILELLKGDKN